MRDREEPDRRRDEPGQEAEAAFWVVPDALLPERSRVLGKVVTETCR